jgi:hypothetical protein
MKHQFIIILLFASLLQAQTPPSKDPTVPDAALQQLLTASGGKTTSKLPEIIIRGKIITTAGEGLVIIEIDKQILTLKKGATLSLSGEHSQTSLQLTELTRDGASIEVLPLKQTLRLQ